MKKEIPSDIFRLFESLIKTGKVEQDGQLIDLSPVQTITIGNGLIQFDPPMRVSGKIGPIRVNTTITEISATASNSIFVDIDNSPINLEIVPS